MNDLTSLFAQIASTRPKGAWPTLEKCQVLAALVIAHRPKRIVEIGVFTGDSLVPMLLALKQIGGWGEAVAIDPWAKAASVEGQQGADLAWWGSLDHDAIYERFVNRLTWLEVADRCKVMRKSADEVNPADLGEYQMLHVDGNHSEQAIRDIERFAAPMPVGSILVLDDLNWAGGAVRRGFERAMQLGFEEIAELGTGCYMQRMASE